MDKLTARQQEILNYIMDFLEDKGYWPSYREIANDHGVRMETIFFHLQAMLGKGAISWQEGQARSFSIPGYKIKLVREE